LASERASIISPISPIKQRRQPDPSTGNLVMAPALIAVMFAALAAISLYFKHFTAALICLVAAFVVLLTIRSRANRRGRGRGRIKAVALAGGANARDRHEGTDAGWTAYGTRDSDHADDRVGRDDLHDARVGQENYCDDDRGGRGDELNDDAGGIVCDNDTSGDDSSDSGDSDSGSSSD
jgi:hypothetical protein